MAVVFMEGFDHIALAQLSAKGWSQPSGGSVVAGRFAGQGLRTNSSVPSCYSKALPASYSTLIVGFAFLPTTTDARDVLSLRNGTTAVVKVATVVVGGVPVVRLVNASGTTLATGTTGVPANAWTYIELKVVVSATVGTVEVRLNGASAAECSGTGLNTGALDIDNIGVWWVVTCLNTYDDIYVVDTSGSAPTNTWLGEVRVSTLIPNGNGANTAWTGAYTDWDDITSADDDTTYVSSSTPGDRETSTLTDLSAATSTVFAVQTNLVARKDDAGTRTIAPVVVIGGTPYDGTTTAALSSSYLDYTQLYDRLAPDGNVWDVTKVNAMETGVKEIA